MERDIPTVDSLRGDDEVRKQEDKPIKDTIERTREFIETLPLFPLILEKLGREVMPSWLVAKYREYMELTEKIDQDHSMTDETKYRLEKGHKSTNYLYISYVFSIGNVILESWQTHICVPAKKDDTYIRGCSLDHGYKIQILIILLGRV